MLDALRSFAPDVLCIGEVGCLGEAGARLKELFKAAKDLGCLVVADAVIASEEYRECLRESVEEKLGSEAGLFEAVLLGEAAGASCVTALGCTPAVDRGNVSELLEDQSKGVLSGIVKSEV